MTSRRLSWPTILAAAGGGADAVIAATAPPFTWRADVTTALGIAGVALVGAIATWRSRHRPAAAGPTGGADVSDPVSRQGAADVPERVSRQGAAKPAGTPVERAAPASPREVEPDRRSPRSGIVVWTVLVSAIAAFELANFLAGPRSQHPTISSLLAVITGHEAARGLLFAIWLSAGSWLWWRS